ncbi:hypothetical protein Bca4012_058843 [Brassica carinata]|uniref:40S ribosomal protein S19 n=1 Tax=Brassica carinata TaxID=52824 RepID=A0A8X7W5C0_BRACI|nr:hypothetical protein Bca52824_016564 [Brassica carinata]
MRLYSPSLCESDIERFSCVAQNHCYQQQPWLATVEGACPLYLRGGLGVGAFLRVYGGSKRNGSRPQHFCKGSGGIARHILQQLETMNVVEIDTKGGRRITSIGQRDLDQVAGRIAAEIRRSELSF